MLHAGAAMAEAADSGKGFAAAVTQGLLAGAMASEQARSSYAQQRLQELEQRRKAGLAMNAPKRGRINWGDGSPGHLEAERQRHENEGWNESSERITKEITRLSGGEIVQYTGADGTGKFAVVNPITQAVRGVGIVNHRVEGRPTRMNYINRDQYQMMFDDAEGGPVSEFIYSSRPDVNPLTEANPIEAARAAVYNGTPFDFAKDVTAGNYVEDPVKEREELLVGFGGMSPKNLSDFIEKGGPETHPMMVYYSHRLDGSVVREGEIKLMQQLAPLIGLPEDKWGRIHVGYHGGRGLSSNGGHLQPGQGGTQCPEL